MAATATRVVVTLSSLTLFCLFSAHQVSAEYYHHNTRQLPSSSSPITSSEYAAIVEFLVINEFKHILVIGDGQIGALQTHDN